MDLFAKVIVIVVSSKAFPKPRHKAIDEARRVDGHQELYNRADQISTKEAVNHLLILRSERTPRHWEVEEVEERDQLVAIFESPQEKYDELLNK